MFNNNLIYFTKYALGLHEYQGTILAVLSGANLLAIPIWAFLAIIWKEKYMDALYDFIIHRILYVLSLSNCRTK